MHRLRLGYDLLVWKWGRKFRCHPRGLRYCGKKRGSLHPLGGLHWAPCREHRYYP